MTLALPKTQLHMTRILFIIDSIWGGGGAETSLLRLVQSLPRDRYQCRVLTFHADRLADSFLSKFPCAVDHWQMTSLYHPSTARLAWRLFRLVREEKIDIVHTFFPVSDLWAGPIAKLSGARFLISSRRDMGILRKRWHGPLYRGLRNFYDEVHAVSEEVRRYTIETDGVDPGRTRTVYNGVDPNFGDCATRTSDQPIVTMVANVRRVKGIDIFIQAAKQVHQQYPNVVFQIAGTFGTDTEHIAYKNEVLALNDSLVQFLGPCSNVAAVLGHSDIFVLPSRSEGFSNALLEAMVSGLPCIATRVGGNPELIVDGETGFLMPTENPAALASRMIELLADPARREAMGEKGRARALAHFTSSAMTARIMASYDGLTKQNTPVPTLLAVEARARVVPSDPLPLTSSPPPRS